MRGRENGGKDWAPLSWSYVAEASCQGEGRGESGAGGAKESLTEGEMVGGHEGCVGDNEVKR